MPSYRITPGQKNAIENQLLADSHYFNPVLDINGDWFIFEEEFKQCGLGVKTEYVPPVTDELI